MTDNENELVIKAVEIVMSDKKIVVQVVTIVVKGGQNFWKIFIIFLSFNKNNFKCK